MMGKTWGQKLERIIRRSRIEKEKNLIWEDEGRGRHEASKGQ